MTNKIRTLDENEISKVWGASGPLVLGTVTTIGRRRRNGPGIPTFGEPGGGCTQHAFRDGFNDLGPNC